jgi:DNA helicase-2/ATP-dependent DNA helicase PcrA
MNRKTDGCIIYPSVSCFKVEDIKLSYFNEGQITAISHNKGPMLVLAGPGSGKTTVITYRIKNLIENMGVSGSNILVITFTRATATEMRERFERMMPDRANVTFGTFHSVFFWILKNAYKYTNNDIVAEADKYQLVRNVINENGMSYDGQDDFAKNILSEISYVKSELLDIKSYESINMKPQDFRLIFNEYEKYLRQNNKIDFDDMLVFTYELLRERQDIRKMWQNKFRYILIDEFQDINKLQYEVVKLLLNEERNIFAVGDDDQSVYSFRGADPEIMLGFPQDFPNAKITLLDTNYRCSRDIVESSQRIIKNNKKRYAKEIVSAYAGEAKERIHVINIEGTKQENEEIARLIKKKNDNGIPYSQMAVIYRTNTEPAGLTSRLMQYNIPFKMKDSIPNIYKHFIAENIIDYIKVALGNRDRGRIVKIINRPNRYVSRESLLKEKVDFSEVKEFYKDKNRIIQNITILENDLNRIKSLKPYAAINYIRKAVGYDKFIKEFAAYRGVDLTEYIDILEEIQDMAKTAVTFQEWFDYIEEYTQTINEQKRNAGNISDAVTLSTMHSAKGLEFDQIFIMNAVEGMTPHKKAVTDMETEEERRMFYVAVTRARYGLYIYVPENMYGKKTVVSRFVKEMILDRDILKEGNKIIHKRYGEGTITYVDDKKICVYFEKNNVTKTLSIEYTMTNNLIDVPEAT